MPEVLANQTIVGTLGASLTAGATTLTLATGDGAKFPPAGTFRIVVAESDGANSERISVGGRSGDTLTGLTRGIEDTTAVSHATGEIVAVVLTADGISDYLTENYASIGRVAPAVFAVAAPGGVSDAGIIQAAIDAAFAAGGGRVQLNPGTYLCTGTVTPKANVEVVGAGMYATTIKLADATNVDLLFASAAHRFALRDLTLDGNRVNQTAAGITGCYLQLSDHCLFERVRFTKGKKFGLALGGCPYARVLNCVFDDSGTIVVNGDGLLWLGNVGAVYSTDSVVEGNTFIGRSGGPEGVTIGADRVSLIGNFFFGNNTNSVDGSGGASGFFITANVRDMRIENNYIEKCGNYGIDFYWSNTDESYGAVVCGNTIRDCREGGVGCASNGALIANNSLINNGQTIGGTPPSNPGGCGVLVDAKNVLVSGNHCVDTQGTKTQTYGVCLRNGSTVTSACTIVGNKLDGNINAGIQNIATIGTGHTVLGNRGAPDMIQGPLAVNSATTDHKLVLESAANDHIRFIRTGSALPWEIFITSDRIMRFEKLPGITASSLNTIFKFGVVGGIDSINPYWNGIHFQGHTVTEAGVDRFPIMGFYSRSAVAADPTDYEFVFQLDNTNGIPASVQYRVPNLAGAYYRWRFGTTDRARLTQEGAFNLSHIATPAAPGAGFTSIYVKTDNGIYVRPGTGAEVQIETRDRAGAASGYATLDANTRVPDAQLGTGTPTALTFLRGDRSWAPTIDEAPRMLNPVAWMGAANLTTVTVLVTNTSYFLYIGRAGKVLSTMDIISRVATAAATITWAEVGVFKGTPVANGAATNLTRLGFTNVATTFNSTGIKKTTVALTGHAAEDDLWIAFGSQATTPYQLRAGLADDIQSGAFQQFAGRISTMGASTGTLVAATLAVPWAQAAFV